MSLWQYWGIIAAVWLSPALSQRSRLFLGVLALAMMVLCAVVEVLK